MTRRGWLSGSCLFPGLIGAAGTSALSTLIYQRVAGLGLNASTPGLAVLVTGPGGVLHQQYVGLANVERREPIGPWTPFHLASVTKPFTALAVLQLAEMGRLRLQDPVRNWLPDFPYRNVRIHHLLTHSGGLPDYTGFQLMRDDPTNADVIAGMRWRRMKFSPGKQVRYSNTGYAVLASLVEAASGYSYASYMRQHVFQPAGMNTTTVPGRTRDLVAGRAVGYRRQFRGSYALHDRDTLDGVVGDSGIHAPAADLDQWLHALFEARLLREENLRLLTQIHAVREGEYQYGYGWVIRSMLGDSLAWHNGNWLGYDSFVGRLQNRGINIILLSNAGLDGQGVDLTTHLGFPIADQLVHMQIPANQSAPMARRPGI